MPLFGKSKETVSAELNAKHRENTQRIRENVEADMKAAALARVAAISREQTAEERKVTERIKMMNHVQGKDIENRKVDVAAAGMFKKTYVGNHEFNPDHVAHSEVRSAEQEEALQLEPNSRFEGETMKM